MLQEIEKLHDNLGNLLKDYDSSIRVLTHYCSSNKILFSRSIRMNLEERFVDVFLKFDKESYKKEKMFAKIMQNHGFIYQETEINGDIAFKMIFTRDF